MTDTRSRKVAIYARVSTEHEAQLSALENQKDWYKPIVSQHPEWKVVRMYVDEGITGTSAKKRPQFMQMIKDSGKGDFDLILTREVSRFARNTVDTLQYTRDLKTKGVEVFFINDNIRTFEGDGELRLTIMATLAQDESRKTSIRVKSGQQTSMENGVFYGNGNILGYDRVGKDMVVNQEQAKTVRMIYDLYLKGAGLRKIQFELEQKGRLTATGKSRWYATNISKILQNSFYCGIITYHKQFTPDFLEQKKVRNFGDVEFTRVKGRHEPIITEKEFKKVQELLAQKRQHSTHLGVGQRRPRGRKQPYDIWSELMICECGHKFNRETWHRLSDGTVQYGYQCYSSIRTGTIPTRIKKGLPVEGICGSPMIAGWKLQMMIKYIFREFMAETQEVVDLAESMLEKHIDDKEPEEDRMSAIEEKLAAKEKLRKRIDNLIDMRADGEITKEIFNAKKAEAEKKIRELETEIEQLQPKEEPEEAVPREERVRILRYALDQFVNPDNEADVPDSVVRAFVKKIVVKRDRFDWYLRFSPSQEEPYALSVDGKRREKARVISSFCSVQHRLPSTKRGNNSSAPREIKFVKIHEFEINLDSAKTYLYTFSTKSRVLKWNDLRVSVFL